MNTAEETWVGKAYPGMDRVFDNMPVPADLLSASSGEIRYWLNKWMAIWGLYVPDNARWSDNRANGIGWCGWAVPHEKLVSGTYWDSFAAVNATSGRMILPDVEYMTKPDRR